MTQYDSKGKEIKIPEEIEKARQAAFEQIRKRAILIDLKRRQFSNMPFDPEATKECLSALNANETQLQVRKFLINPEHLSPIRNIMNDASLLVVNHTRPWENVGMRVLPMDFYDDFTEAFGQCVDNFEVELDKLVTNWDTYVKEAKKNLGKAFNKKDYPTKDQLKQIFHLSIETAEFPNIEDIRLGLGGHELLEMQNDVSEKYTDALHDAFNSALEGIKNATTKEDATKFYNIATTLNIADNPDLEVALSETLEEYGDKININDDDESMMVMDDIDTMGVELEPDPTETECNIDDESECEDEDFEDIDFDNLI